MPQKIGADGLTRSQRYKRKMVRLGFKGGVYPKQYVKQLEYNKAWNKLNHESLRKSNKKQNIKMKALLGATGPTERFLYPRLRKDRKGRLKGIGN